jgi:hypothetical protein
MGIAAIHLCMPAEVTTDNAATHYPTSTSAEKKV